MSLRSRCRETALPRLRGWSPASALCGVPAGCPCSLPRAAPVHRPAPFELLVSYLFVLVAYAVNLRISRLRARMRTTVPHLWTPRTYPRRTSRQLTHGRDVPTPANGLDSPEQSTRGKPCHDWTKR